MAVVDVRKIMSPGLPSQKAGHHILEKMTCLPLAQEWRAARMYGINGRLNFWLRRIVSIVVVPSRCVFYRESPTE